LTKRSRKKSGKNCKHDSGVYDGKGIHGRDA
jgi:hypothetical protein